MADNRFRNRQRAIKRMEALPDAVKKRVHAAMEKSRRELENAIRDKVPVDEGDLKASVKSRDASDSAGLHAVIWAGDPDDIDRKAWGVEFGHTDASTGREVEAQPFFFPTYRALRKRIRSRAQRAARDGIKEALSK